MKELEKIEKWKHAPIDSYWLGDNSYHFCWAFALIFPRERILINVKEEINVID